MKDLMMLWTTIAKELGDQCGVSTALDVRTVEGRIKSQGWSFMTITLPDFGKDLERALAESEVSSTHFVGFKRSGETPLFLGGFLDLIFDRCTGYLLAEPNIDSIHALRQLTLLFGKMELETSEKRFQAAMNGFIKTDNQVQEWEQSKYDDFLKSTFKDMSSLLWSGVFRETDLVLWKEMQYDPSSRESVALLRPKHGPGATADRLYGNAKWDLSEWHERLETVFPYGIYMVPNERPDNLSDRYRDVTMVGPEDERPVRVVAVPKTAKSPRIIAIEPTCMQYAQQAASGMIVDSIVRDEVILAGSFIGFFDQSRNRRMAEEGSVTGDLATLDLSEASDRVSFQLVQDLVHRWPLTREFIEACRSTRADVQGHGVLPLAKFASMGSALTFPVEAMVFLTVVFIGIQWELGFRFTQEDVRSFLSRVQIFGDDIIVPADHASSVISALETFGLKVNTNKSFWTGKFRESCGREFYDGHDVSIVRVRKVVATKSGRLSFPTSRKHVPEIESLVALRNRFYAAGLWRTASHLDERIRPLLKGCFPIVDVEEASPEEEMYSRSRLLGRWSFLGYQTEWTHPTLHSPLVKGWVVSDKIPSSKIEGVGALQKVLSKRSDEPFADRQHLERAGRPEAVYMKLRRVSPF